MEISARPVRPLPRRLIAGFVALFLTLYAGAAGVAEVTVGRAGQDTALQKLLALRGQSIDWLVLGASHALPLAYGDVPGRLRQDTGQSMAVLAEVGAGPVYNRLVFAQALRDTTPRHLLYVVDSFAFAAPRWNEDRIGDRKLLRQTPLRVSTATILARAVLRGDARAGALADYLTAFSKLNPPDRFARSGWRGAADFDREARLSRHAVASRIDYLYPEGAERSPRRTYLDTLEHILRTARSAGLRVTVMKLPLPEAFRAALPAEAAFDTALRARLGPLDIPYHDLGAELPEARYYFDTDHLNRAGIEALYTRHLRGLLATPARP